MSDIVVLFGSDSPIRFVVEERELVAVEKNSAAAWFTEQFDLLGCHARSPTGKLMMRNVVVDVATAAGQSRFDSDPQWSSQFALNCAALFKPNGVQIDVGACTLSVSAAPMARA